MKTALSTIALLATLCATALPAAAASAQPPQPAAGGIVPGIGTVAAKKRTKSVKKPTRKEVRPAGNRKK
jgi:hypothetical protein